MNIQILEYLSNEKNTYICLPYPLHEYLLHEILIN